MLIILYRKEGIELMCIKNYKKHYNFVLVGLIVDYKEQVLITGIKANI